MSVALVERARFGGTQQSQRHSRKPATAPIVSDREGVVKHVVQQLSQRDTTVNDGVGCSIETLAELIGDTPKWPFDHYGKEWGQHYQDPLWATKPDGRSVMSVIQLEDGHRA